MTVQCHNRTGARRTRGRGKQQGKRRRTLLAGDEKALGLMKLRYGDCGRLLGGEEPPGGDAAVRSGEAMVLSGVHVIDEGGEPTTSGRPVSKLRTYGPAAHAVRRPMGQTLDLDDSQGRVSIERDGDVP